MNSILVHFLWLGLLLFAVAFISSWTVFPLVLRIARVWKMYDKPNARKLQRNPVPVLGGVVVFFGILLGFLICLAISFNVKTLLTLGAMLILLIVGVFDDKRGLPVSFRFIVEFGVIIGVIFLSGNMIDHFHGLFGIEEIPHTVAVPLSVIAGVGIINAINLIDGVDGYSSGFTALACTMFGIIFFIADTPGMAIMCLICTGAVLPFFFHNVFGKKTKMFIGDGGTLMIGTLMTAFVFSVLKRHSACNILETYNLGLIPACLAILSIPVFDTLRVMIVRMFKGHSPFSPDKTHLHHLYIDMGYSHYGTMLVCLGTNFLIILLWILSWVCGASITMQTFIVVVLGILATFVYYPFMRWNEANNTMLYRCACSYGFRLRVENTHFWDFFQKLVDDELFSEGKEDKQQEKTDNQDSAS